MRQCGYWSAYLAMTSSKSSSFTPSQWIDSTAKLGSLSSLLVSECVLINFKQLKISLGLHRCNRAEVQPADLIKDLIVHGSKIAEFNQNRGILAIKPTGIVWSAVLRSIIRLSLSVQRHFNVFWRNRDGRCRSAAFRSLGESCYFTLKHSFIRQWAGWANSVVFQGRL